MSRKKILTKEVLASIPEMIARDGLNADEIAQKLGCKISTLKVRCSQAKISLRGSRSRRKRRRSKKQYLRVSSGVVASLRNRAAALGKTEEVLACELLETIARDDLYDAVLDHE
jgi:hypothetical protein